MCSFIEVLLSEQQERPGMGSWSHQKKNTFKKYSLCVALCESRAGLGERKPTQKVMSCARAGPPTILPCVDSYPDKGGNEGSITGNKNERDKKRREGEEEAQERRPRHACDRKIHSRVVSIGTRHATSGTCIRRHDVSVHGRRTR